eukprot:6491136-Amphidinium_carterae.1
MGTPNVKSAMCAIAAWTRSASGGVASRNGCPASHSTQGAVLDYEVCWLFATVALQAFNTIR